MWGWVSWYGGHVEPTTTKEEPIDNRSVEELWLALEEATERSEISFVNPAFIRSRFDEISCAKQTALPGWCSRYLHANWMGQGISERKLIASQYPFADEALGGAGDFWSAVYRELAAIVDLTNRGDRMQFYYPCEGETLVFNDVEIRWISTKEGISIYRVHPPGCEPRYIARLHFAGWPDHGVISLDRLHQLISQVEFMVPHPSDSVLVHCRAGVGRTGTVIAALIIKEQIERGIMRPENLGKDLVALVLHLRQQRNGYFVQNLEQFRLLYDYACSMLSA